MDSYSKRLVEENLMKIVTEIQAELKKPESDTETTGKETKAGSKGRKL